MNAPARFPLLRLAPPHLQARGLQGRLPRRLAVRRLLALGAAGAALFAGCRDQAGAANPGVPTSIGVGAIPSAPGYESILRGVELAVERLKGEGATFRIRRPLPGSTSAVQIAQQLRDDPHVLAVVGHPESGNTLEAVPIYADAEHNGADGVVVVSPTATSPRLTGLSPWFFRVAPSDSDVARFTATWVADSLHSKRVAIIYRNDSYGRDWADVFAANFSKAGDIVAREPYLTNIVEWDAYAELLARLRPDLVLFPGDADDATELLKALHELQVSIPLVGGDGTEAMKRDPAALGARYVTFFDSRHAEGAEAARFLARYRERFNEDPDYFAAQAYDATLVIGRTAAHGARTRAALRLALEKLGSAAPAIDGVGGRIGFRSNHDLRSRQLVMARVEGTAAADSVSAPRHATAPPRSR